ncbi:MAG: hypothetical protein APR56_04155 [Methanosaeta sp. SDB]|nr:MAG: hypothetical protein APR56_04155 [Methanosaeta sp. SDB]
MDLTTVIERVIDEYSEFCRCEARFTALRREEGLSHLGAETMIAISKIQMAAVAILAALLLWTLYGAFVSMNVKELPYQVVETLENDVENKRVLRPDLGCNKRRRRLPRVWPPIKLHLERERGREEDRDDRPRNHG